MAPMEHHIDEINKKLQIQDGKDYKDDDDDDNESDN